MADWPAAIRDPLIACHVSSDWPRVGFQETSNVDQLYDEVRHAGPLPDIPLIILCSTGIDAFRRALLVGESESLLRGEIDGRRRLYEDVTQSVPRGVVRLVNAGHVTIHLRHRDAVLRAIQDVLSR